MNPEVAYLIGRLNDDEALTCLAAIEDGDRQQTKVAPDLGGLKRVLQSAYPNHSAVSCPTDGELARRVLLAAAQDSRVETVVRSAARGEKAESFGDPLTVALVVAAVIVLHTRGYLRFKGGSWEVDVTVHPPSQETLAAIVEGLLRLLP